MDHQNGMRRALAQADLTALDLLSHAVQHIGSPGARHGEATSGIISTAYPDSGEISDDHLLMVVAIAGQAANLLKLAAHQADMDPAELLDRIQEQTRVDAARLLDG